MRQSAAKSICSFGWNLRSFCLSLEQSVFPAEGKSFPVQLCACVRSLCVGREEGCEGNLLALFVFSCVDVWGERAEKCVCGMRKTGRENSVKQLFEFSVNWAELLSCYITQCKCVCKGVCVCGICLVELQQRSTSVWPASIQANTSPLDLCLDSLFLHQHAAIRSWWRNFSALGNIWGIYNNFLSTRTGIYSPF